MRIIEYKSSASNMKWKITVYEDYVHIQWDLPLKMPIVTFIPMKIFKKILGDDKE